MDAVFLPGIDIPIYPSNFNDLGMGSSAENPMLIDEEQDQVNSPPVPSTPVTEKPTHSPVLMRSRKEHELRKFPILFSETCLN